MKIIKLQAENIKKLKAVEITPQGNTVVISGKNGQGKTSVLDSIWLALGGGAASKDMIRPVRDGQKRASVKLDLGDMIVTRTWSSNEKSYLQVESKDGAVFKSPQKMLDGLVGRLSFDPLAFAQQDEKTQLKTLLELVTLPVDPAVMDGKKAKLYEQRRDVNRDFKQYESKLGFMSFPDPKTPAEEISSADVIAELRVAQAQLNKNNEMRGEFAAMQTKATQYKADIQNINDQIALLQQKQDETKAALSELVIKGKATKATIETLVDPALDSFQEKLNNIDKTNQDIRNARDYKVTKGKMDELESQSSGLTEEMQVIDEQKDKMLKEAKFPIDGLGFDENGVTFKGFPFKQCSSAERLRVSLAMAMALNPDIRVIRITDGSLLDSGNMRLIEEMAKDRDCQVWMEVVDETGKLGVYIEDGEVKN
ncbi:MAG: AAA family ATPase [Dehalococcoidia bacterium]